LSGNPIPQTPVSLTLGPDGNLYEGFARDGAIVRFLTPATFDPTSNSDCQNKMSVPFHSPEPGVGHAFGLGWIGHDAYGGGNISPYIVPNADQCLTPGNGNKRCAQNQGSLILGNFIAGPEGGLVSDSIVSGPSKFAGNTIYAATLGAVTRVTNVSAVANMTLATQFGGTFCSISGMTVDPSDLANQTLYVGSDCTLGSINGAGAIWQIKPSAPDPAPPAAPINVIASDATPVGAGPTGGVAQVSWTPISNGQPVTGYTIKTFDALGNALPISVSVAATPPSTVVPTTGKVPGLTLGNSYKFTVAATNASGSSPDSPFSNVVTPKAPLAPSAITDLSAVAGIGSASLAWTPPASNGSAITSYTVTTTDTTALPNTTATSTVAAPASGAVISGLINGHSYSFNVVST